MFSGGIGWPALATDSSNISPLVEALTETGRSAAPWVSAFATRLESSCAMRPGSLTTRSVEYDVGVDHPVRPGGAVLGDNLHQRMLQLARGPADGQPAAEPAAGEIEHVVDEPRHPAYRVLHQLERRAPGFIERRLSKQPRAGVDGGKRIAQVMAEHRDELVAQFGRLALAEQRGLAGREALPRVEVEADQVGEQPEHADRLGRPQLHRTRVDRAERSEKRSVGAQDGHRDVALKAIHRRCGMAAKSFVLRDVIDHDRVPAVSDLAADGGFHLQLSAGLQAEGDLVANRAGNPTIVGHARDRGESHAGRAADHFQDRRNHIDRGDRRDVGCRIISLGPGLRLIGKGQVDEAPS